MAVRGRELAGRVLSSPWWWAAIPEPLECCVSFIWSLIAQDKNLLHTSSQSEGLYESLDLWDAASYQVGQQKAEYFFFHMASGSIRAWPLTELRELHVLTGTHGRRPAIYSVTRQVHKHYWFFYYDKIFINLNFTIETTSQCAVLWL